MAARTIPDRTRNRVLKLYESGATNRQIIDQTGVAPATIYWLLRQAGREPDRRKPEKATDDLVLRLVERIGELERQVGRLGAELEAERRQNRTKRST